MLHSVFAAAVHKEVLEMIVRVGKWGSADDKFLIENYESMSNVEIALALNTKHGAVLKAKKRLGLRQSKSFTEADDDILRKLHKTMTVDNIASSIGRSPAGVRNRLKYLGLEALKYDRKSIPKKSDSWSITPAALQFLQENSDKYNRAQLSELLSIPIKQITYFAKLHGIKLLRKNQLPNHLISEIVRLSAKMTAREIATALNLRAQQVHITASRYNAKTVPARKNWTYRHQQTLLAMWAAADFSRTTRKEVIFKIAKVLKRAPSTIGSRIVDSGLKVPLDQSTRIWSEERGAFISLHAPTQGVCWVAEQLGIPASSISALIRFRKLCPHKCRSALTEADIRYLSTLETPPNDTKSYYKYSRIMLVSSRALRAFFSS
ncbi:hypothetical protein ACRCRN_34120 [Pseudomonas aeruginosa]